MIRVLPDVPRLLQVAGLIGAGFGMALVLVGGDSYLIGPVLIAMACDVAAIRTRPSRAVVAAALKVAVVFAASMIVVLGRPVAVEPLLPQGAGLVILIVSSAPSLAGAILRRMS